MAEIKSSGSSRVVVPSDTAIGSDDVWGPWTALDMGVDQATHPITFDSLWALLVIGTETLIGQFVGVRLEVELGVGPTDPPAETVWGPMRYTSHHTGGGRGHHTNYSFPLELNAGDQVWARCKKDLTMTTGVQELMCFLTVSDQFQPVRPATVHLSTTSLPWFTSGPLGSNAFINSPGTEAGVRFPGDNILGLWYEMTTPNSGLLFNASWMSITVELIGIATTGARWQLGAVQPGEGSPPNLPELIDVGFQSQGGGGQHVSENADVMNFPIPWVKGDSVWIRGSVFGTVNANPLLNHRDMKIAAVFWGNP